MRAPRTIAFFPGPETTAADGRRVVIDIRGFEFVPAAPVVRPGDVVVWRNFDIVPHTVTAKDDSWDSGTIAAGSEWKTNITDGMVLDYYCRFHPSMFAALQPDPEPLNASLNSLGKMR